MKSGWILLCGLLAAVCTVQSTYTYYSILRCDCNGRSRYCLRDASGVTAGGAAAVRTASPERNVTAAETDRSDPTLHTKVTQSRQPREDSGSLSLPCFCYGHSSQCSPQSGYSVHAITSNFATGPDGWKTATAQGVTPDDVHFHWSPKHQDVEVISKNSLPVYLYAPAPYLGNQLLSYGQNFSFSLRLDRGVRHPSTNDVILEGAGLRVSASLGDLRSIVPCGQKISYSFRLDEQHGSRWRPRLSSFDFQTLLQNLTAIKIRATFGENGELALKRFYSFCKDEFAAKYLEGRGYLDNVKLVSAQRGDGSPARWVQTCSCPQGYEGEFCERCSDGFTHKNPADGAFSTCPHCKVCQEGFYGDPTGSAGIQRPCTPCKCNGHIDVTVAGSCDRSSGECLKCLNNTKGRSCEACVRGFYHSRTTDACKPCDCDVQGSESQQCDDSGRCRCRPGFEGLRCQRSNCPTCFGPIKAKIGQTVVNSVFQMEAYAAKLKELETLFSDMDAGFQPANREMEASLRAAQDAVEDMQSSIKRLADLEKDLQSRLSSISRSQLADGQDIQFIAEAAVDIKQRQQTYKTKVDEVQTLIEEMRRKLVKAQTHLRSAEVPLGDAPLDSNSLSHLVKEATGLADEHQTDANAVERSATDALMDSEKSLALVRMLMNRENKVKELIGDLRTMSMLERPEHGVSSNDVYVFRYDQTSNQVRSLEDQASRLSGEARDESKMADGMLKDITRMEQSIPPSLKDGVDAMVSRLGGLREEVDGDISGFEALQDGVQRDMAAARDLLTKGTAAQQKFNKLVGRVNVAKADTEDALQRIKSNTNELDDALNTLKGFDQQIDGNKALADDAIKRLPGINATIQQAVSSNAETLSVLGDVSDGYHSALGTINVLENVVNNLEETFGTLPSQTGQAIEASNELNQDVKNLKTKAVGVAGELNFELDAARRLEADADQAAVDAAEALNNAKQTQAAVGKTLQDINSLLADLKKPGVVDENLLKKLEDSLAGAQSDVEGRLRPRLRDMEEQEAVQRRRLTGINQDIDTILRDIANLEDILNAVPSGCYNSPPIEEP
ncbi:Laminin subunit gamma-2 [Collichthys lucidus]|uniref:Laminin subunit gamma-2 n=1 Tax=Collichthys lucidus TaxID=240159 RepID=A0A4U5UVR2_COLLU|nr:Laminin subunit gamma-2 [Collichthys lucidus]